MSSPGTATPKTVTRIRKIHQHTRSKIQTETHAQTLPSEDGRVTRLGTGQHRTTVPYITERSTPVAALRCGHLAQAPLRHDRILLLSPRSSIHQAGRDDFMLAQNPTVRGSALFAYCEKVLRPLQHYSQRQQLCFDC